MQPLTPMTEVAFENRAKERWLVIAPIFNCDGRAASQTVTDKLPRLRHEAIELTVVSGVTGEKDASLVHRQVWSLSPSGLRFDLRHIVSRRHGRGWKYRVITGIASLLLSPAILVERMLVGVAGHWGWSVPAAISACLAVRTNRPDVLFSSGGPVSAHLAGWIAHRLTGIPWVAEVHDPIVERPEPESRMVAWAMMRERWLRRTLESLICRDASLAWWFTENALSSASRRNPNLGARGFRILPGSQPSGQPAQHVYRTHLTIGHFGILSDTRSLAEFVHGLAAFLSSHPEARRFIQVNVYGSALDPRARASLQAHQLDDLVRVFGRIELNPATGESGRTHVNRMMQECDALLLLHGHLPRCAEYIPSKVYEYFWAGRAVFALVHLNDELTSLVRNFGGIAVTSTDPVSVAAGLKELWSRWQSRQLQVPPVQPVSAWDATGEIVSRVRRALKDHSPTTAHPRGSAGRAS